MKLFILNTTVIILSLSFYLLQDKTKAEYQDPELAESMERGSEIYSDFCVTCHLPSGEGAGSTFPPLAGADYLMENREASIRGVKYGQQEEIVVNGETYTTAMPNPGLEDDEIADVMNYILNSWGNSSGEIVNVEEVEGIME